MSEKTPESSFENNIPTLKDRIRKIQNEKFAELYESSADFIPELRTGIEEKFPNEPLAWEMIPAYHQLAGSSPKESEEREVSIEAKHYIERKISDFIKDFED
ncbi:MAG: hypothetical protein ACK42D_04135 [Candidatus Paceibacteria bacterium]